MQQQREAKEKMEAESLEGNQEDATDAIHLIHELIDKSHDELRKKVLNSLIARENMLRMQIKDLLISHNEAISQARPRPPLNCLHFTSPPTDLRSPRQFLPWSRFRFIAPTSH